MRLRRQIWLLRQLRQQIFGSGGSVGNHFAPTANLASRQLSRQIFGSVSKYLAMSAKNWLSRPIRLLWQLGRQIFGSGSSVGNHVAPAANLASRQLSRQNLGPSANIWLRRQILGSVGQFGFCGSSVGKYLDPAALLAIMLLRRQIWLLGSSVGKYLGPPANIWLFGSAGSSVGK
jgi:hypothetical protein